MNFLINRLKQADKNDAFRPAENPNKYNDSIALLNSEGSNQYSRLTTEKINQVTKTQTELGPSTTKPGNIPGLTNA